MKWSTPKLLAEFVVPPPTPNPAIVSSFFVYNPKSNFISQHPCLPSGLNWSLGRVDGILEVGKRKWWSHDIKWALNETSEPQIWRNCLAWREGPGVISCTILSVMSSLCVVNHARRAVLHTCLSVLDDPAGLLPGCTHSTGFVKLEWDQNSWNYFHSPTHLKLLHSWLLSWKKKKKSPIQSYILTSCRLSIVILPISHVAMIYENPIFRKWCSRELDKMLLKLSFMDGFQLFLRSLQ
jgi:hypothetical protein